MRLIKRTCTIYHGMIEGEEYLANFDYSNYDIYGGFYGDCTLLRIIHNVPCLIAIGDNHGLADTSKDVYVKVKDRYEELYMSLENILKNNLIDKIIR